MPPKKSAKPGLVELVREAKSFKEAADIVQKRQRIPDLDTVEGLQECNTLLPKLWNPLKDLWGKKDEKLMGALCVIFGRMSKDSVLRSKLAKQGAITLLTDALQYTSIRLVVLRCLSVMTSHSGSHERISVADKASAKLISIATETPSDDPVFMYCVSVLCHTSFGVFSVTNEPTNRGNRARSADARPFLELMVRASRLPGTHISGHAFGAVSMLTVEKKQDVEQSSDAISCLVGHLRHPELTVRVDALRALYTLYLDCPKETVQVDPHKAQRAAFVLKNDREYEDEMVESGPLRSLLFILVTSSRSFQDAMMDNIKDRDMYKLGMKLYQLLMRSEWGIGDGAFAGEDGRPLDLGLPYVQWFESLPHCISALRAKNPKSKEATMLEIKYNIKHRRWPKVHQVAKNWIDTVDPDSSYCYYALAMNCSDQKVGLSWSKKGLRTQPDGYVKLGLLFNAVDYAGRLGIDMLAENFKSEDKDKHMMTAVAYFHSALQDAKAYMDEAPADDRLLRAIMARYLCLYTAIKGPAHVDADLNKFESLKKRMKMVERFSEQIWSPVVRTTAKSTWELINANYKRAAEEWDPIFSGRGLVVDPHDAHKVQLEDVDGLELLVEQLSLEPECHVNSNEDTWKTHIFSSHLDESMLELVTCSYCGNPSAQIRKCSRCGGVRYCDTACQKRDWKTHKQHCGQS